jgi:uncharacterized protein
MKNNPFRLMLLLVACSCFLSAASQPLASAQIPANPQVASPRFRVLVLAETGDIHAPFVAAAKPWLAQLAADSNFAIDYIENPKPINDSMLAHYRLFIQLNYPPYRWSDTAKAAFERYIEQGRGGWVGLHHASLLGEFDGYPLWHWFSNFMGGIRWKGYIAGFATATVHLERDDHPVLRGLPAQFVIDKDEWYIYDKDPRPNVEVLATVDEASYSPASEIKMGDHPVIWSNTHFGARNVYIQMGHRPELFNNVVYTRLLRNAISWAAGRE